MHNYYHTHMMVPRIAPCVKLLIICNVTCWFLLVLVLQNFFLPNNSIYQFLGFVPSKISSQFFIWQFVTYMFIHSQDIFHILFNMIILWMFGSELEHLWRRKFFFIYYLVCGIGSAVVYFICVKVYVLLRNSGFLSSQTTITVTDGFRDIQNIPVVGASGAVFGLLLAYGLIFGERIILFMFIFPMKAKTFTLLIAAIELLTVLKSGFGSPVANLAHLGGLISGFLFLNLRKIKQQMTGQSFFFYKKKKNPFKVLSNGKEE